MLANVLPGLRELRAPLAAGYLWLLLAWVVWGDKLPGKGEKKADPLERLYQLEPVISSIGLAVVASVGAYMLGSIVIDLQTAIGGGVADRFRRFNAGLEAAGPPVTRASLAVLPVPTALPARWLALTDAGSRMLERWESARADELRDEFRARELTDVEAEASVVRSALEFPPDKEVRQATRQYIASNRDLLKTQLLDASQPLHSNLDRPDAEATFRMALWPPLAALVIYLALEVSPWWWFAVVAPLLLAWQWISLRRTANDALVAAFMARAELGGEPARAEVRKDTVRRITERLRLAHREPPQYLLEYLEKPTPAAPSSPRPAVDLPAPGSDAGASGGQSKQPDESKEAGQSHQPESPPEEPEPSAGQSDG